MSIGLNIDAQKSTPERIAEGLRAAILRGDVAPGAPLREADVAAEAGASRNTVREAMRLLAREGLVTHSAFKSVTVTELSEDDVTDIFRARLVFELAGADAMPNATPAQIQAIADAANSFDEAVEREDWQAAFERDIDLHTALVATVGSSRLDATILSLMRELRLAYGSLRGMETEARPEDRDEHQQLASLVAAGDRSGCRSLIERHLARSEELLLDLMRRRRAETDA